MSNWKPTHEQEAIVNFARESNENLLVSALAGAAKTSTLVLIANALRDKSILTLAFNKKIAVEMQERLPQNCKAMTLNSLGYKAWNSLLGRRLHVDEGKTRRLLRAWVDEHIPDPTDREDFYENDYLDLNDALRQYKTVGWLPDGTRTHLPVKPLMNDDEFREWLDFEPNDLQWEALVDVARESLEESRNAKIDYDDMIYLPALFPVSFPSYQVVMVDEAQDLSAINHVLVRKVKKLSRLIAVGDECQSIYGFRGAHQDSMNLLKRAFDMKEMHLTVSFRCPQAVVRAARWRAPAMQYPEWAVPGTVSSLQEWTAANLPDNATIICRNNAPLFRMAIRLIRAGRFPELVGMDIGKRLIAIMEKLGDPAMPSDQVCMAIELWAKRELAKKKKAPRVQELADCLTVFAEETETLGAAITRIKELLSAAGPVKLMTGHKSKGLEFPHVFILDRHLCKTEDDMQERNLLYVMQTRAQETLTYVTSEGFQNV